MAQNLRLLSNRYANLTTVAEKLQISKQQLNRYLQGENIPSERLLNRICDVFGITEIDLVDPHFDLERRLFNERYSQAFLELTEPSRQVDLADGKYDLYLADTAKPGHVVRSLVLVRRLNDVVELRRMTSYVDRPRADWRFFRGDHRGVVLQSQRAIYLCAVNSLSVHEPSMVVLEQAPRSDTLFIGHAFVTDILKPTVVAAVMVENRSRTMKRALQRLRALPINADEVPPVVRSHLTR